MFESVFMNKKTFVALSIHVMSTAEFMHSTSSTYRSSSVIYHVKHAFKALILISYVLHPEKANVSKVELKEKLAIMYEVNNLNVVFVFKF
ncbi:hypothetical protein VNO78_10585 [Psophocarpus tetragonolobus]|uniref:Uncharacterized protein n=1 Tax=Psophocarpus tetragonolobus TaxID=3891 RepID=A0AAN9SRM5_PSOTE